MALPLIAAGVGVAGKLATGFLQGRQAKKLERANPFVPEEMSDELKLNLADAELRANNGLASSVYNNAEQNINRGTSTYLRQFGKTGRAGSLLSAIRGQNDALLKLDMADASAIENNRNTLRQQRGIVAGEKARLWNVNVRQPYEKVQQRIQNLRSGSNANIGGSFTDAANLGAVMLGAPSGVPGAGLFGGKTLPGIGATPSVAGSYSGYNGGISY